MSSLNHLAKIQEGVEAWNEWRSRDPLDPDLSGADLRGYQLGGADLRRTNLSDSILTRATLVQADLRGADLTRAMLGHALLIQANLTDAVLSGADLRGCNLRSACLNRLSAERADMSGVCLVQAVLTDANLRGVNLQMSNFSCADLGGADCSGADLGGVDLSDAALGDVCWVNARAEGMIIANCSLSGVRGISQVAHVGPSAIDSRSLSRTIVDLSVRGDSLCPFSRFLRGCGLSEWEISISKLFAPNLSPVEIRAITDSAAHCRAMLEPLNCLPRIVYSNEDEAFVTKLVHALQEQGVRCWMNQIDTCEQVPADESGVCSGDRFVLIASKSSLMDPRLCSQLGATSERFGGWDFDVVIDMDGEVQEHALHPPSALAKCLDFSGYRHDEDDDVFVKRLALVVDALRRAV